MGYRIDRRSLHAFLDHQITLIEATPLPPDVRSLVAVDEISDADLGGVWLGAGIATQVALPLLDAPQRFVELAGEEG